MTVVIPAREDTGPPGYVRGAIYYPEGLSPDRPGMIEHSELDRDDGDVPIHSHTHIPCRNQVCVVWSRKTHSHRPHSS